MPRFALSVLVGVAVAVACVSHGAAEDFVPHRTHLVDTFVPTNGARNFLFRGNNPKENDAFAYDALVASLTAVAANHSLKLPTTFKLVDVSLLVGLDPKESGDLKLEEDFFKANPTKGYLINWPLITDLIGPCIVSEHTRIKEATDGHWDLDDLPAKVPVLRSLLHTEGSAMPIVIYVHCEAGVDRTGEIMGSYVMGYQGKSYKEVLAFDDSVEPRPISFEAENGLQWMALYYQYNQTLTTPDFKCSL